jgi:hypothetical protein
MRRCFSISLLKPAPIKAADENPQDWKYDYRNQELRWEFVPSIDVSSNERIENRGRNSPADDSVAENIPAAAKLFMLFPCVGRRSEHICNSVGSCGMQTSRPRSSDVTITKRLLGCYSVNHRCRRYVPRQLADGRLGRSEVESAAWRRVSVPAEAATTLAVT